jgi:hypothetical protein
VPSSDAALLDLPAGWCARALEDARKEQAALRITTLMRVMRATFPNFTLVAKLVGAATFVGVKQRFPTEGG